ncbi:MAG: hypothetical protein IPN38_05380 [Flavobacteriales bacterium]|nr:hypothetical protein [Flavobacteriales bacterium]
MRTFDIALRNAKQEVSAAQEALQVVRDGISRSSAGNTIVRSTIRRHDPGRSREGRATA